MGQFNCQFWRYLFLLLNLLLGRFGLRDLERLEKLGVHLHERQACRVLVEASLPWADGNRVVLLIENPCSVLSHKGVLRGEGHGKHLSVEISDSICIVEFVEEPDVYLVAHSGRQGLPDNVKADPQKTLLVTSHDT